MASLLGNNILSMNNADVAVTRQVECVHVIDPVVAVISFFLFWGERGEGVKL